MNTKLIYSYLEMKEENISQSLDLKKIKWVTSYFIEEMNQNELMRKKYKKVSRVPSFIEKVLILASAVTEYASISALASLVGSFVPILSSALELKIWAQTAWTKTYKSIIKKKIKRHDKIVLLSKTKLNSMKVLISKALTEWDISHNEFHYSK